MALSNILNISYNSHNVWDNVTGTPGPPPPHPPSLATPLKVIQFGSSTAYHTQTKSSISKSSYLVLAENIELFHYIIYLFIYFCNFHSQSLQEPWNSLYVFNLPWNDLKENYTIITSSSLNPSLALNDLKNYT